MSRTVKRGLYYQPLAHLSVEQIETHKSALTVAVTDSALEYDSKAQPIVGWSTDGTHLIVPKRYGLSHFGVIEVTEEEEMEETEENCQSRRADMRFEGCLQNDSRKQEEAARRTLDALEDRRRRGATLVLPCGYGKTVVSLYVASRVGGRTLVLCHKTCLLEQWGERVRQYLPDAKIGLLRGPKCQAGPEEAVVLGMLQSVYSHDYPDSTLEGYDLVIVDEAHHVPAVTFLKAITKVGATRTLALTATPKRRDGAETLLYATMGDIAFQCERQAVGECTVRIRQLIMEDGEHQVKEKRIRGGERVNLSRLLTDLSCNAGRTRSIGADVIRLKVEEPMRRVMILSDRVQQLKELQAIITDGLKAEDVSVRLLIGATKTKNRPDALAADIILTTFAFSQEGVDKPRLDTLVMASPKGDVVQAVGRILRAHPEKCPPLILDYEESVQSGILRGLYMKRMSIYRKHEFRVDYVDHVDQHNKK